MVYEEFVTEIADRLRRSFPDAVSIQLLRLPRNNGHPREALCIREADHSSSPAIYLEPFWESYRHGVPIELLQEEISVNRRKSILIVIAEGICVLLFLKFCYAVSLSISFIMLAVSIALLAEIFITKRSVDPCRKNPC